TKPSGVILRMLLLPLSATIILPAASMVRPAGALNEAAVPCLSANAATPLLANGIMVSVGSILRMRLLAASDTYVLPVASVTIQAGEPSTAVVPSPARVNTCKEPKLVPGINVVAFA